MLVGLQIGVFRLVFRSDPPSLVGCTILFIRFWSGFDRHDNEGFGGENFFSRPCNRRASHYYKLSNEEKTLVQQETRYPNFYEG